MTYALIVLAAALALGTAAPYGRLGNLAAAVPGPRRSGRFGAGAKNPRDGPGEGSAEDLNVLEVADDIALLGACLSAGLPLRDAVRATAGAAGATTQTQWRRAASLLAIGVGADRAWIDAEHLPGFEDLARMIRRSEHSGAAIAAGCEDVAERLRSDAVHQATARAERAGVLIAAPISGCFLPAFVILGLVPVIASLGMSILPF